MDLGTTLPPLGVIIIGAIVVLAFFRHLVGKILGFLILEIIFLVFFPGSLVLLARVVSSIRNGLGL